METFVHMHDGETVYYEDACYVCEAQQIERDEMIQVPGIIDREDFTESFQFGVLIGTLRAKGIPENEIRDMTEFALSMCRNVP